MLHSSTASSYSSPPSTWTRFPAPVLLRPPHTHIHTRTHMRWLNSATESTYATLRPSKAASVRPCGQCGRTKRTEPTINNNIPLSASTLARNGLTQQPRRCRRHSHCRQVRAVIWRQTIISRRFHIVGVWGRREVRCLCPFVYGSVCLFICICLTLSISFSVPLFVYVCVSMSLSVFLSVSLSVFIIRMSLFRIISR